MREGLLQKLKRVRAKDIGHIFLFLAALIPALLYKRRRPHLWLVCENENEARDNGYWFFKYLREKQPQEDAIYAIKGCSGEYNKVASLGATVEYGSYKHWIYYLMAEVNIGSQKYGKPNAAVCYLLEVILSWPKNTRVFLQHGVTKDDLPFLHYDQTKISLFCCAAKPEYEFVRDTFGYPEGAVQYVGLCRFDSLYSCEADKELVLIVPTWRMWLERKIGQEGEKEFLSSEYYWNWNGFINSDELHELLRIYGKRAVFCLHRNMEKYERYMSTKHENVQVLGWQEADITGLIHSAGTLITDFSSVYMDFAYMKKPVVYFQFDKEAFRAGHLPEGYFEYERDGFGPVCEDKDSLIRAMEEVFRNECRMSEEYAKRVDRFYTLHDDKNCERTYEAINALINRNRGKRVC